MSWLRSLFGKGDVEKKSNHAMQFVCSRCLGGYDASCIVIMPWWNETAKNFTTTYRCLLCLPDSMVESRQVVSNWNDNVRNLLCSFMQRHRQEALASCLEQSSPDEAQKHFDDFLKALESWQIRLRPSVVPQEVAEQSSGDGLGGRQDTDSPDAVASLNTAQESGLDVTDWTAMDNEFLTTSKHQGPIEDRAQPNPETMQMILQASASMWQQGEHQSAISMLEGFRQFQLGRRRLLKEDTFQVLLNLGHAYRSLNQHQQAAEVLSEASRADQHTSIQDSDRFMAFVLAMSSYVRLAEDGIARELARLAAPAAKRLLPIRNAQDASLLGQYFMCCGAVTDVPQAVDLATQVIQEMPRASLEPEARQELLFSVQLFMNPPRAQLPIDKAQLRYETSSQNDGKFAPSTMRALFELLQELLIRQRNDRATGLLDSLLHEIPAELEPGAFDGLKEIAQLYVAKSAPDADKIYSVLLQYAVDRFGLESVETARIMAPLATAMLQSGAAESASAAITLLQRAVPVLVEHSNRNEETLAAKNSLAIAYANAGRYGESIDTFREVLPDFIALYGEPNPITLGVMASLARSLEMQGNLDEARNMFEKVCQTREQVLGSNHPDTIRSWANLGEVELKLGRNAQALECLTKSLQLDMQTNGIESESCFTTLMSLATAYFKSGERDKAIELGQMLLPRLLAKFDTSPMIVASGLVNLVSFQLETADQADFVQKLNVTRDSILTAGTLSKRQWLQVVNLIVQEHKQCGQVNVAIALLQDLLVQTDQEFGHESNPSVYVGGELAVLLISQDRTSEAIELLENLCQRAANLSFEDRLNVFSIRHKLAVAYLAASENEKARDLLQTTLDDFLGLDKTGLENLAQFERTLIDGLAKAQMRCGDLAHAAANFERVLAMSVEVNGRSHPDTRLTALYLWKINESLGNSDTCQALATQFELNVPSR